ncbi:MAG: acyl carrier protein [Candidatus Sulfotelmatobacter sp.]
MIQSADVKDRVREYVLEEFAKAKGIDSITDDESLTKNGVIDSMGIFRLVAFLEETFGVRVGDEEITHDNLESVDAIEKLVLAKSKK